MFLSSERFLRGKKKSLYHDVIPVTITVKSNWQMNFYVLERKEAKHTAYLAVSSDSLQMYSVYIKVGKKMHQNLTSRTILFPALPS